MHTLNRYLAREIAQSTGLVLIALIAIFALFDVINQLGEVGRGHYQFFHALAFVALLLPSHAYDLMPIAALIGTIYALARLAANSEFTIMRVSGMTTWDLVRSVVRVGLMLVALAYLCGEFLAPPAEDLAQRFKARATGAVIGQEFHSGVWVRDLVHETDVAPERLRFVNAARVNPDGSVQDWLIYEFDPQLHLRSVSTAKAGAFVSNGQWLLSDVNETLLPLVGEQTGNKAAPDFIGRSQTFHHENQLWRSDLTPGILGVLLVQPERQSAYGLYHYIHHLAQNHQHTERYEIAFWKKILYPLVCLAMMAMAVPFAYLHVRAGTVGLKILGGILIGVIFYAINKLFANLGLINTWSPAFVAGAPALFALICASFALYWVERR